VEGTLGYVKAVEDRVGLEGEAGCDAGPARDIGGSWVGEVTPAWTLIKTPTVTFPRDGEKSRASTNFKASRNPRRV
jgi:hypothetical protein